MIVVQIIIFIFLSTTNSSNQMQENECTAAGQISEIRNSEVNYMVGLGFQERMEAYGMIREGMFGGGRAVAETL